MDRVRDFLKELRTNYDNSYWWADHQVLQTAIIGVMAGAIGLLFVFLECKLKRGMLPDGV